MHSFKVRLAHTEHAYISEDDIPVFDLVLGTVFSRIHAVEFFGEVAFPKKCTNDGQPAGRNNAFVCKFKDNVFVCTQCDLSVVVHDKMLLIS